MADDEEGGGGFMMLFVTLSLILLAFFILLNSMATMNDDKTRKALGSLLGSFGNLPGGTSGVESDSKYIKQTNNVIGTHNIVKIFNKMKSEAELLSTKIKTTDQIKVTMNETTGEIKIVMADNLLFDRGSSVLSPKLFSLLSKIAGIAQKSNAMIKVIGHTDSTPAGGKYSSNWHLSLERGTTVAKILEDSADFKKGDVMASGLADYHQDKKGDTFLANARRVEILVKLDKAGAM
ncbi:MAG: OmpA family protein [Deltaproteobacteria bacterium]|nr:OmpA family protein [Deltaproteobacteria bacterium]